VKADLDRSYAHCRRIARTRARNFYYAFVLLSSEQRDAMCAVYAFNRACDDLSDEPGARREGLVRWREQLDKALRGRYGPDPLWPAFHHTVQNYGIPIQYFHQMIEGVSSDLEPRRIRDFDELYRYCYQVASVVGMTVIHIFGFTSSQAIPLAEKCGVAFQLTNILRDVREDAERGRIYLPAEDLQRFGVTPGDLISVQPTNGFVELMRFETARARSYYDLSQPLLDLVDNRRSRRSLSALISIYRALLDKIEASGFDVLSQRVSLSAWHKAWIVLRSALT